MANSNGWGDGAANNNIGWGQGAINNSISWGKSHINSWSGATDIDGGNAPTNTVAPAITGTAQEGQTLTCSTGTWTGTPTYTYQWKRNGSNIGSATNSTYTLVTADVGTSIKCTVTATNFVGSSTADSNTVTPTSSTDADAQAFITAASITDPTQQSAINNLVVSLKGYSIWTKMKGIWPFVGGTASQHKFNLKDPRDLDAAFRLVFSGGWTHSSTGATPNGTNGYADTKLNLASNLTQNSTHLSFYSRTNTTTPTNQLEMGAQNTGFSTYLGYSYSGGYSGINSAETIRASVSTPTTGMLIGSRIAQGQEKYYFNNVSQTLSKNSNGVPNSVAFIGASRHNGSPALYSSKQCAFASIGEGLTDTEAANFYTAVQAFQTTLGRSIGTQTVSDADAQAFVTAANIDDQVEATAINNLVIGLKADSLWTKMKAIYPFVGGTASQHKFNLKDPRDLDAAFRLVFNGGWTHSSTGSLPNGTNAYADTKFIPNSNTALNSYSQGFYSRTNIDSLTVDMGGVGSNGAYNMLFSRYSNQIYNVINSGVSYTNSANTDSRGFYIGNRTASNVIKNYKNSSLLTTGSVASISNCNGNIWLGAFNNNGAGQYYTTRQYAFSYIGDGLTDTEAANLYTAVQAFQTALNRNV